MFANKPLRLLVLVFCVLLLAAVAVTGQDTVELSWITDLPGAEEVAAKFTEYNPNITVRVDKVSFREVFQQNQIRLGSGSSEPDIVSVDAPVVASYGFRGWLLPWKITSRPTRLMVGWMRCIHPASTMVICWRRQSGIPRR